MSRQRPDLSPVENTKQSPQQRNNCESRRLFCLLQDAHNCCIEFDEDSSLFAVYDGHGGHEVATYCAKELPCFIKNTEAYKNGNIKQALIDAFLGFDAALTKPDIANILKEIAGTNNHDKEKRDSCCSGMNVNYLCYSAPKKQTSSLKVIQVTHIL